MLEAPANHPHYTAHGHTYGPDDDYSVSAPNVAKWAVVVNEKFPFQVTLSFRDAALPAG